MSGVLHCVVQVSVAIFLLQWSDLVYLFCFVFLNEMVQATSETLGSNDLPVLAS